MVRAAPAAAQGAGRVACPLTRDETAEQLDLLLGPGVAPGVVGRVYRRSHGQPLFTEQLAARPDDQALPELLGELLDRRLDRLGGRARTVARALAVADRPLGDALLVDITGLSSDGLSHGLHELDDRHLLAAPRAHELRLRHPLLADAVTTDLSAQLGKVLVLAARAAADLADSLPVTSHRRQQLLAQLDGWLAEATHDPFAPQSAQTERHALATTRLAETTRLAGTSSLERWVAAANAWDALSRPHDAAYCRWRGAQVAARTGRATTSRRLLTRAGRDAREHAPLFAALSSTLLAPSGAPQ